MPETVVGLFRTRDGQLAAVRALERAGFGSGQVSTSTPYRGRTGHYGAKLLAGVVLGTLLGIVAGALAAGLVPGVKPLIPGNLVATFIFAAVAGAATGGVAGMLVAMAASGDRALYYEQEVESGRYLVSVAGPRLAEARAVLLEAAPWKPRRSRRPSNAWSDPDRKAAEATARSG